MFSSLEQLCYKSCFHVVLILLFPVFFSSNTISQEVNNEELESKLIELSVNFKEYQRKIFSENDEQSIDQLKEQMDQSVQKFSDLYGAALPVVETFKDTIQAYYSICRNNSPEFRKQNLVLFNDLSNIETLAKEQGQSIYPDSEVLEKILQFGNCSFLARTQNEVEFLNSELLLLQIPVYAILGMWEEKIRLRNRIIDAKSHYIRFDKDTDAYYSFMLASQIQTEDYDLEQTVNIIQELLSYYDKYGQFETFRDEYAIWKCNLALSYLRKGKIREGGEIILQIRYVYDDLNPLAPKEISREYLEAVYLVCKFYTELGIHFEEWQLALNWLEDSHKILPDIHTIVPQAVAYEYYYRKRAEILKHLGNEEEAKEALAEAEKIADNLEKCRITIREAIRMNDAENTESKSENDKH